MELDDMMQDEPNAQEREAVREAHHDWCAEQAIDPASPLGLEAEQMMVSALRQGSQTADELVSALYAFGKERQILVRRRHPTSRGTLVRT